MSKPAHMVFRLTLHNPTELSWWRRQLLLAALWGWKTTIDMELAKEDPYASLHDEWQQMEDCEHVWEYGPNEYDGRTCKNCGASESSDGRR